VTAQDIKAWLEKFIEDAVTLLAEVSIDPAVPAHLRAKAATIIVDAAYRDADQA
jgi:uncharacterized protein (UPF0147 family)